MKPRLLVAYKEQKYANRAEQIGGYLASEVVELAAADTQQYRLLLDDDGLRLLAPKQKSGGVSVGFFSAGLKRRVEHGNKDLLLRALACPNPVHIVDATSGLANDAFVMATAGHELTLLEASSLPYVLVKEAISRGLNAQYGSELFARMHLIHTEAVSWLQALSGSHRPQIVYLDPMFETPGKRRALTGQGMQALQYFTGNVDPSAELLEVARSNCLDKVVVKRGAKAPALAGIKPNHCVAGRTVRFDVYLRTT